MGQFFTGFMQQKRLLRSGQSKGGFGVVSGYSRKPPE
jgi:hypothetical protein